MNRQGLKEKGDIEIKNTENKTRNSSKEKSHIPNKIRGVQDTLNKIMSQVKNIQNIQEYRLDDIISSLDHIISANDAFEKLPSFQEELQDWNFKTKFLLMPQLSFIIVVNPHIKSLDGKLKKTSKPSQPEEKCFFYQTNKQHIQIQLISNGSEKQSQKSVPSICTLRLATAMSRSSCPS